MISPTHTILASLVAISMFTGAHADTITLKSAARHQGETNIVTLGDVASLEGDEAQRLASVQVGAMKTRGKPMEITVAEVRKALDAAGVNWAKVDLSGRSVIVRPQRDEAAPPPQAMTANAIEGAAAPEQKPTPIDPEANSIALDAMVNVQTIGGSIANLIIANLRVDPRSIRVRIADEDKALLQTDLADGRFEVQPLGSFAGDRLAFSIRAWNGNAAESRGQVTLLVQRQTPVSRLRRDVSRSDAITEADIQTVESWLSPSEAMQVAPRASVVGRSASRSMHAGETIRVRDIDREATVKRGQLVTIRCLVGGVAISLQAEARAEGSIGDALEFRKTGERDSFLATVTGPNEAVVDLGRK